MARNRGTNLQDVKAKMEQEQLTTTMMKEIGSDEWKAVFTDGIRDKIAPKSNQTDLATFFLLYKVVRQAESKGHSDLFPGIPNAERLAGDDDEKYRKQLVENLLEATGWQRQHNGFEHGKGVAEFLQKADASSGGARRPEQQRLLGTGLLLHLDTSGEKWLDAVRSRLKIVVGAPPSKAQPAKVVAPPPPVDPAKEQERKDLREATNAVIRKLWKESDIDRHLWKLGRSQPQIDSVWEQFIKPDISETWKAGFYYLARVFHTARGVLQPEMDKMLTGPDAEQNRWIDSIKRAAMLWNLRDEVAIFFQRNANAIQASPNADVKTNFRLAQLLYNRHLPPPLPSVTQPEAKTPRRQGAGGGSGGGGKPTYTAPRKPLSAEEAEAKKKEDEAKKKEAEAKKKEAKDIQTAIQSVKEANLWTTQDIAKHLSDLSQPSDPKKGPTEEQKQIRFVRNELTKASKAATKTSPVSNFDAWTAAFYYLALVFNTARGLLKEKQPDMKELLSEDRERWIDSVRRAAMLWDVHSNVANFFKTHTPAIQSRGAENVQTTFRLAQLLYNYRRPPNNDGYWDYPEGEGEGEEQKKEDVAQRIVRAMTARRGHLKIESESPVKSQTGPVVNKRVHIGRGPSLESNTVLKKNATRLEALLFKKQVETKVPPKPLGSNPEIKKNADRLAELLRIRTEAKLDTKQVAQLNRSQTQTTIKTGSTESEMLSGLPSAADLVMPTSDGSGTPTDADLPLTEDVPAAPPLEIDPDEERSKLLAENEKLRQEVKEIQKLRRQVQELELRLKQTKKKEHSSDFDPTMTAAIADSLQQKQSALDEGEARLAGKSDVPDRKVVMHELRSSIDDFVTTYDTWLPALALRMPWIFMSAAA